jgi:hypothetical protein
MHPTQKPLDRTLCSALGPTLNNPRPPTVRASLTTLRETLWGGLMSRPMAEAIIPTPTTILSTPTSKIPSIRQSQGILVRRVQFQIEHIRPRETSNDIMASHH